MTDAQIYAGAAAMGAVAGLRSMSAPAMVSQVAKAGRIAMGHSELDFLHSPKTAYAMTALAVGEVIADKLPFMPKRTKGPSVLGRAVTGGLSGAAISSSRRRSPFWGAIAGAAGAIGATYAFFYLRCAAKQKLHVPDPVAAVIEDAVVAASGMLVLSKVQALRA
ncbi:MAG: DUF4126 family protein [Acidobacteriaceae bacterium]|nr:DUF4126 family protein [Acidobacteriaceae bacterium]